MGKNQSLYCPVCERETQSKYVGKYRGKSELFNKNERYQCLECMVVFINPLPTASEIDEYYKSNWRKDADIYADTDSMDMVSRILSEQRCDYLIRNNILSPHSKVLDVGSGDGFVIQKMQNKGFKDVKFFATDPSPVCLQKLKALGVNAFPSLQEVSERNFDLVILGQVVEHISEPIPFLESVIKLLKNGGYIYIDVPQRDDTHKPLSEPHVLFYSKESLLNLVGKLKLKVVHLTGYGVKLGNWIFPKSIIHRGFCKIRKLLNQFFGRESEDKKLRKNLFDLYEFDQENDEGRWLRIFIKVEK
jgi:SAM-dependent methyltransferase